MSPLDYVKKVRDNLEKDFKTTGLEIKLLEDELDALVDKYEEQDKLLTEYEKFIEKNEESHAVSECNQGILVESSPEDVRQPGTES